MKQYRFYDHILTSFSCICRPLTISISQTCPHHLSIEINLSCVSRPTFSLYEASVKANSQERGLIFLLSIAPMLPPQQPSEKEHSCYKLRIQSASYGVIGPTCDIPNIHIHHRGDNPFLCRLVNIQLDFPRDELASERQFIARDEVFTICIMTCKTK